MKQRLVSFLYRNNVRSALQIGAQVLIASVGLLFAYLFIIAYWAAFYP